MYCFIYRLEGRRCAVYVDAGFYRDASRQYNTQVCKTLALLSVTRLVTCDNWDSHRLIPLRRCQTEPGEEGWV